jgi:acetylglutamate kinase
MIWRETDVEKLSSPLVVLKIGGAGVDSSSGIKTLAVAIKSCLNLGSRCVIVHGGGQQLTALGKRLGLASNFVAGRRVTDDHLITAAKMSFAGQVGTDLAAGLWAHGVSALSLSGVDAGMISVRKRPPVEVALHEGHPHEWVDYGWVGDIESINPKPLLALLQAGFIPLVASLGVNSDGQVFNVNADTIAGSLAEALGASRLVMLTDVDGFYSDRDDPSTLISRLVDKDIERLKESGSVSGGMLPKLNAILNLLKKGIHQVHMVSWQDPLAVDDALCGRTGRGTVFELGS